MRSPLQIHFNSVTHQLAQDNQNQSKYQFSNASNTDKAQIHYMITVKIEFRGKLTRLGKEATSLQAIKTEVCQRFPEANPYHLQFYVDQKCIEDYSEIVAIAQQTGKNSIKLKIIENPEKGNVKNAENQQKVEENEEKIQKSEIKEKTEQSILQSLNKSELAGKIEEEEPMKKQISLYTCYHCKGIGLYGQTICQICSGHGEFHQNHPYIEFLDKIIFDRMSKYMQKIMKVEQQPLTDKLPEKKEEIPKKKEEIPEKKEEPQVKIPQIPVQQPPKVERKLSQSLSLQKSVEYSVEVMPAMKPRHQAYINQPFKYHALIVNNGEVDWPEEVEIYDSQTQQVEMTVGLKARQRRNIDFGPFSAAVQGRFEKKYYFCYTNEKGEKVRFGNKFGFWLHIVKPIEIKKIDFSINDIVMKAKKATKSSKSVEYLIEKLKALGITSETINELQAGFLQELITQFSQ